MPYGMGFFATGDPILVTRLTMVVHYTPASSGKN